MLNAKRVIPSLAAAAIPLSGTGCSDESPAESVNNAVQSFCSHAVACGYFQDETTCIEDAEFLTSYFDTESDACALVFTSYFQCLRNLDCDEFEIDDDCYAALAMGVESDC